MFNMDNENEKNKLISLYSEMSDKLINDLRISKVSPNEVALDVGVSSEKMLDLLFNSDKGDYLAYREIDASIKKLTKNKIGR